MRRGSFRRTPCLGAWRVAHDAVAAAPIPVSSVPLPLPSRGDPLVGWTLSADVRLAIKRFRNPP